MTLNSQLLFKCMCNRPPTQIKIWLNLIGPKIMLIRRYYKYNFEFESNPILNHILNTMCSLMFVFHFFIFIELATWDLLCRNPTLG
jgi:hypothetical protein